MSRTVLALGLGLILAAPVSAADDEQKAAREILDKAIKAMGGAEPVAKMKSLTWKAKAKVSINEVEVTTTEDWSAKNLDKYRIDVSLTINNTNNITGALIINGDKGWSKANDKINDLPKGLATGFQNIFRSGRLMHLLPQAKEKPYTLSPLGELKVGEKETLGVRIGQKDRPDVSIYFDKKTGLPLKAEVRVVETDGAAELAYEVFFNEYKDFDGLKHPSRIVVHRDGKQVVETEVSDVKAQDLDDGVFDKP
jgi:hypothetical protein